MLSLLTEPGDHRITMVEVVAPLPARRTAPAVERAEREMSLIDPVLSALNWDELEQRIPHYRKRHWMRPGLSGWAQVCAPYASSIQDSDLKLSYDLTTSGTSALA